MAEIGTAFLTIAPSMKGFGTAVTSQASGEISQSGGVLGGKLGKAMLVGFAAAGVAAGVGKALYEIGSTFDDVSDTIRSGTGATGSVLEGLEESAKKVGRTVPSSFADISDALAEIHSRLDLTGKPLEEMTAKMLNLSRLTETDLISNVEGLTRVFGDWGISMKDQPDALDAIYYTSQQTGAGIDALAESVVKMGAPLRQFGFSFEDALAIFGKWEEEGVNTTAVMSGLKIGLGKFSKAGEEPKKALGQVQQAIMDAGSAGEANKIAIETFGQRAGPDMAAAVREGRFELGSLVDGIKDSKGALQSATEDTKDFSESWQIFKNRAMVGLEPIATAVFTALGDGMAWVNAEAVPAIRSFVNEIRNGNGAGGDFADTFRAALGGLRQYGAYVIDEVVPAFRDALTPVIRAGRKAFNEIRESIRKNKPELTQLWNAFKRVAEFIQTKVIPLQIRLSANVLPVLSGAIQLVIDRISFWVGAFNKVVDILRTVRNSVQFAIGKFKDFKTNVTTAVKGAKAAITQNINAALGPIRTLISLLDTAINKFNELRGKRTGGVKGNPVGRESGESVGRSFGDGVSRGITASTAKVSQATERLLDKLKSKLDTLKSEFASLKDSVAGAFTGNLFESETASGFISNLLDTKGQLTALKAAFTKLIGWGLKPEFLSQLFQSGNGGLILDLAAGTQAQAQEANALFGDVTSLSNSLGANVADAKFGDRIDAVKNEIKELRKDVKGLAREIGAEVGTKVNSAASGGRRLARV